MTDEPNGDFRWSASDALGVINVFEQMLLAMEARLVAKMDENSRMARDRWVKHDQELEANTKRIVARFEAVERDIQNLQKALDYHLDKEHDEEIRSEARVKPIKGLAAWFWRNWRDIVLLMIGLLALAAAVGEWFGRVIGTHAP